MFTAQERADIVALVAGLLKDDPEVEAVALVGSLVHGGDRWSDVDIDVLVADDADVDRVASRWVARMYAELPVLHHLEQRLGPFVIRGFLLRNMLEVDLAFIRSDMPFTIPTRLLHDRSGLGAAVLAATTPELLMQLEVANEAAFLWLDVVHAVTAVRRRRSWLAAWYVEKIRNRAFALTLSRHGHDPESFKHVDDLPSDERVPLEAALVRSLERSALLDGIEASTRGALSELHRADAELAERLEAPLLELIAEARHD
jgi:predicted nucleotidyltransferase